MANSADPDQLASSEANWSGSTLFAKGSAGQGLRTEINIKKSHCVRSKDLLHLLLPAEEDNFKFDQTLIEVTFSSTKPHIEINF